MKRRLNEWKKDSRTGLDRLSIGAMFAIVVLLGFTLSLSRIPWATY